MSNQNVQRWREANRRYLSARLAVVRDGVASHRAAQTGERPGSHASATRLQGEVDEARRALPAPSALDRIGDRFELGEFERDVLVFCAGCELDASFAAECAAASGNPQARAATAGLALAALRDGTWSALTPASPLRYWRFIEVVDDGALHDATLSIDERILHYLQGVSYLDPRLRDSVELVVPPEHLPESHQRLAHELAAYLEPSRHDESSPVLQLGGNETTGKRAVAAAGCALLDLQLHVLRSSDLPPSSAERVALIRLWHREALLSNSALLIEHDDSTGDAATRSFIERAPGMLLVASREPVALERSAIRIEVNKPSGGEQRAIWEAVLGERAASLNGQLAALTAQFDLNASEIHAASVQALAGHAGDTAVELTSDLWSACRRQARRQLRDLARHLEPTASWSDLVLPESQLQTLHDMVAQVRYRARVYDEWGFAAKGPRGLGITALFAGSSGTGKTLAAEVVAGELQLDLYRIDLSQIVSKYIGETEKNLRRVFESAQDGGAVLLFDEADALFGKRSDVKDSHDRYANIEVSYLLQRMEEYRGLAILTTNMKTLIDPAFLRRLRFIVEFPFPDAAQRAEIWRRVFPAALPRDNVPVEKLGQLSVSGGSIRNIALQAAFYAADSGEPVSLSHLLRAAQAECAKLEKTITPQEVRGWV